MACTYVYLEMSLNRDYACSRNARAGGGLSEANAKVKLRWLGSKIFLFPLIGIWATCASVCVFLLR